MSCCEGGFNAAEQRCCSCEKGRARARRFARAVEADEDRALRVRLHKRLPAEPTRLGEILRVIAKGDRR